MTDDYFTTDVHRRLREEVREFAETTVRPQVADMEQSRSVDHKMSRLIAEKGWIGVTVQPAYGGLGLGHLAKTIVIEELARVSGAMGAMAQASQLGVAKILHFGDEAQKWRWLPAVSTGECLPTIAVTEPESGGHVLGMSMSAERDGDEYVLNGRKVFVGNSHVGDLHGVVARTGPGSKGLSAFLVPSTAPGLSLPEHGTAMGLHGFSFGELVFDDCRVPAENLLGSEGDGLNVAYSSSTLYGRPNLTAVSLGIHQAIVEETARFAREHQRYGQALGELPTVKQKLGQLQSDLMTARILAYHAVHLLDQGLPCDTELMNAKLVNVELSLNAARTAMEVHAAYGLSADRSLERLVRDAHHIYAPAGTSDVQRLRLAENALGKSQSQWSVRLAEEVRSSAAALEERGTTCDAGSAA
ncbi:acyl-CoA dehydrogenase family protein [Saccharomonospora iraqiensis]|uniref:acyl-CoA dehydrogenase family protein n=1 Tax=Saccharomonospora iraqiensis TaxID=52698 RepID=UPI00054DA6A3|nr:acyl-CoA dehydrogenase family protein [Saccharomonospora iraqiensis]